MEKISKKEIVKTILAAIGLVLGIAYFAANWGQWK
jgi:hypothetical protein